MKGSFSVFWGVPWVWAWLGSCLLLVECIMWACGWPVVGLFSIKFEKWVVWKSIWPRGFLGVSIFGHPPPLYRAVVSVDELYEALPFRQCRSFFLKCRCGWAGWVVGWAGVIRAILAGLRGQKNPRRDDVGEKYRSRMSITQSARCWLARCRSAHT